MQTENHELFDFKLFYQNLRRERYEASFLQDSIAEHCSVSVHLVRKWLAGSTVRPVYVKLLVSFDINDHIKR